MTPGDRPPPKPPRAPESTAPDRAFQAAFALLVLLAAALRAAIAARPLAALDGRTVPDDAYISLHIAKNIGLGLGPLFGDDFTNGFQPLYVWLMAIPAALSGPQALQTVEGLDHLVKQGLALGAAADLGALILVVLLLRRQGYTRAALAFGLLWALHPAVLATALNGLETSLAIFFFALIWSCADRWRLGHAPPSRLVLLGLVIGLGALARIDLLMVGVYFALCSLLLLWRGRRRGRAYLRRTWLLGNVSLALGVALGFAPWLLYSLYYTQRWYPISGQAVRFLSLVGVDRRHMWPHYRGMLDAAVHALEGALAHLGRAALVALALALLLALTAALRRDRPALAPLRAALADLGLPLLFGLSLFLAYTFYIFCPWYFGRYLAPLTLVAFVVLGVAFELLLRALPGRPRLQLALFGLALAAAAAATITLPGVDALLRKGPNARLGYRNLGLWARKHLPAGARIGAPQSGALAYYATHLDVINLDGVVNAAAFRALKRRRMLQYIRDNKIHTIIGWQQNIDLLALHSSGLSSYDWQKKQTIKGFRSWGHPWLVYEVNAPPPPEE
jgi:hypothetical protein